MYERDVEPAARREPLDEPLRRRAPVEVDEREVGVLHLERHRLREDEELEDRRDEDLDEHDPVAEHLEDLLPNDARESYAWQRG